MSTSQAKNAFVPTPRRERSGIESNSLNGTSPFARFFGRDAIRGASAAGGREKPREY